MDMEVKRSELETHGLRIARAALALSNQRVLQGDASSTPAGCHDHRAITS
jgi:hypothetical protein